MDSPTNAQPQPNPIIGELKDALNAGDKAKVTAAVKSLRAEDPSLSEVRRIVDGMGLPTPHMATLAAEHSAGRFAKELWVLSESGTDADWIVERLLSMREPS